jgi:SAM-dependent methyltransferase
MTDFAIVADHSRVAFDAFAPHYDAFTSHHDYELWIGGLLSVAEQHGFAGTRLLDVACGTGKSLLPFVRRGFSVTACDHSEPMLELARQKAPDVAFHLVDARELPVLGQFDLITALGDIVNYQLQERDLVALLSGIRRNLGNEGLAIFDANTLWMYGNFFADSTHVRDEQRDLRWECLSDPNLEPDGLAIACLSIGDRGTADGHLPVETLHYQRHYPVERMGEALGDAGLELVAVLGQFPDVSFESSVDEHRHSKAIYLARASRLHQPEGR